MLSVLALLVMGAIGLSIADNSYTRIPLGHSKVSASDPAK